MVNEKESMMTPERWFVTQLFEDADRRLRSRAAMVIDVVGVKEDATHIRYEPSGGTPLFAVRTDTAGGRGIAPDRALMVLVADLPAGLRPHGWTPTGGWMTREEADDRAAVLRGEKDGAK